MTGPTPPVHTELRGRAFVVAATAWVIVMSAAVAAVTTGLVRGFKDPSVLRVPLIEQTLDTIDVSVRLVMAVALIVPMGLFVGAAVFVFVRRSHDWMALLFPVVLVCLEALGSSALVPLLDDGRFARLTALVILNVGLVGLVAVLFLFPNGRIHPTWARVVAPACILGIAAFGNAPEVLLEVARGGAELGMRGRAVGVATGVGIGAGVYAQIHRFRHVSDALERQQAKWVVFPLVLVSGVVFLSSLVPTLTGTDPTWVGWILVGVTPLAAMIPVCVVIAISRYRLYDIDVVISKTVVFAGLAAFITAIYVGIVVGVGSLLGAGNEPNLALSIVATGVVAVAFQPVRERLTRLANRLVFGHRATPYEVLSTFAGTARDTASPGSMLDRMAKLVADGTGADRVFVWLRVDEQVRAASVWPEVFLLDPIPDRELGDPASAVFEDFDHVEEVVYDGDLLGAITLTEPRGEALNHTERELLADLAGQAALVLRNLRLTEELRGRIEELHSSRRRLVRAQDDERRRLERDLHDGAQRHLALLTRAVREAQATAGREGAGKAAGMLVQVAEDGEAALRTVGELAHGIYPPVLASEGLPGALSAQAARAAVPVKLDASDIGRYHPDVEAAIYFCVLEAVNNAAKYADASQVTIRLAQSNGHLTFEVSDDGVGFDPTTTAKGHGTTNMADRLDALGGVIQIESRPAGGTAVGGRLPAERREVEVGANL